MGILGGLFLALLGINCVHADYPQGSFCIQTLDTAIAPLNPLLAENSCGAIQAQNLLDPKVSLTGDQFLVYADSFRTDREQTGLGTVLTGGVLRKDSELFQTQNPDLSCFFCRSAPKQVKSAFSALETRLDHSTEFLLINFRTEAKNQAMRVTQVLELVNYILFRAPRGAILPLIVTGSLSAPSDSLEREILQNTLLLNFVGNKGDSVAFFRSASDYLLESVADLSTSSALRANFKWALRAPNFLNAASDEAKLRRSRALTTVQKAKAFLQSARSKGADIAADLETKLSKDLPSQVERFFLLN